MSIRRDELDELVDDDPAPAPEKPRQRRNFSVRSILRGAFIENAALKFVAFVLALTIFILVQNDEDVHVGVDVGLSYLLPDDRVLVTDRPEKVRVTVKGSRRKTRRFSERQHDRIYIDLRDHTASEYVFRNDLVQLPDGLQLVRFTPESFRTEFDRRTEKTLPVEVRTTGEPERGYWVKSTSADPAQVLVRGGERQMLPETTIRTQEIPLAGRTKTFTTVVPLVPPSKFIDVVDNNEVEVEIRLEAEQGQRRIEGVVVAMRPATDSTQAVADRFEASPRTVTVVLRGAVLDIEGIKRTDLDAYVEIFNEDIALSRKREAHVTIDALENIGVEITPPEVTISPK